MKTWIQSCGSRVHPLPAPLVPQDPLIWAPCPFLSDLPIGDSALAPMPQSFCTGCSRFLDAFPLTIHVALTLTPSSLCSDGTFSGRLILNTVFQLATCSPGFTSNPSPCFFIFPRAHITNILYIKHLLCLLLITCLPSTRARIWDLFFSRYIPTALRSACIISRW